MSDCLKIRYPSRRTAIAAMRATLCVRIVRDRSVISFPLHGASLVEHDDDDDGGPGLGR